MQTACIPKNQKDRKGRMTLDVLLKKDFLLRGLLYVVKNCNWSANFFSYCQDKCKQSIPYTFNFKSVAIITTPEQKQKRIETRRN